MQISVPQRNYSVNSIRIVTCKETYSKQRDKYIFKSCPKEGIAIDVQYADTHAPANGTKSSLPTILALHGAPGSYSDFEAILKHFETRSVRVISPNFPDIAFTDANKAFRHTAEEKSEFVHDFLKQLHVERVDVAVMHSAATYPCLKLWKEQPQLFKSLVVMNPIGGCLLLKL